jgi:predicted nucleotidyltransferase
MMDKLGVVFRGALTCGSVILFGSRAKGTYRPGSDIDLAFRPYSVDVVDDGPQLYAPLKEHIARVGIEIYRVP